MADTWRILASPHSCAAYRFRLVFVSEYEQAHIEIAGALAAAVDALKKADAATEALARFEPPRRRALIFTQDAQMVPLGRVWRLGVFLLGLDGALYATGHTTRAVDPKHPGYQSLSAEERRDYRAAAFRGVFARGETVNFDADLLVAGAVHGEIGAAAITDLIAGSPLVLRDGHAFVRWSATAHDDALRPMKSYLAERVELLLLTPR